jgi:hypothetical protein
MGAFFGVRCSAIRRVTKAKLKSKRGAVEPGEALCDQFVNKCPNMLSGFIGYAFSRVADLLKEDIQSVLPVKELPQVDPGRIKAKTMTRIRVEENSPVVKLLPEHDHRVGYGFVTVFDRSASLTLSARHRPTQSNTCSGDKNDMCNPCARASAVICIIIRTSLLPIVIMKFTGNHRETVHRSLSRATLPSEIFYRFRKSNVNEFRKNF